MIAVTTGVMVSVVGSFVAPVLLHHLGAQGNPLALSLSYIRVIMTGGVFFILTMALNSALGAQGEARIYRNFLVGGFLPISFSTRFSSGACFQSSLLWV